MSEEQFYYNLAKLLFIVGAFAGGIGILSIFLDFLDEKLGFRNLSIAWWKFHSRYLRKN